jgi:uncharacterized glyoxalase superfamily protein PhnB
MSIPTSTARATSEAPAIHAVSPFICVAEGSKLIEFMKATFGAEEGDRHPHGPDGFVASVRIEDSDLLIMGGESLRGQELFAALHVFVKDCDAVFRRSLEAGAVAFPGMGEPADRPYGERSAFVSDPAGSLWFIATRFGPSYFGEGKHVIPSLLPSDAGPLIDFLNRAFDAKLEGVHEEGGRIMHAFIQMGEATLELGELDQESARPYGFYLHTDDVDLLHRRAVAAGGISILPPADQAYGDRLAIVQDPAGNRWFLASRVER